MGMGISVSVDSWVQQTLEELSAQSFPSNDSIYRRLVSSATTPSEIFVIESSLFEKLMLSQISNVKNILTVCLENFFSNEDIVRLNATALLTRMFPFMCMKGYPINFESFLLDSTHIFELVISPGEHIISTCMELISSIPTDDGDALVQDLDGNIAMIDLLVLSVFLLIETTNNLTLYHQLIVSALENSPNIVVVLLNYVHMGGRSISLIALLTLLMFHPTHEFLSLAGSFLKSGGQLSSQLCKIYNDDSDLFCFLCSLAFKENILPPLSTDNPALLRLSLLKILMNPEIVVDPYSIQTVLSKISSPIASAILGRIENLPPEINQSLIMKDFVFEDPIESSSFSTWIMKTLPKMFLFQKIFLFKGTHISYEKPNFAELDQFVSASV